jgi:LPXTG-motif cell wall-anchored protein
MAGEADLLHVLLAYTGAGNDFFLMAMVLVMATSGVGRSRRRRVRRIGQSGVELVTCAGCATQVTDGRRFN